MNKHLARRITWLMAFSVAMGYLEAAVVVYLRALYYPTGFRFPLAPISPALAVTEFWREAATLVMLAGVGFLFGKDRAERLAGFVCALLCGIWRITVSSNSCSTGPHPGLPGTFSF
jgi:hypothetical protein